MRAGSTTNRILVAVLFKILTEVQQVIPSGRRTTDWLIRKSEL